MTMAKKKGRRESMMAIDALKDLFLSDLLPTQRKLKFFYQQPLTFAVRFSLIMLIDF
jgi:ribosome biogenesis protein MAK21